MVVSIGTNVSSLTEWLKVNGSFDELMKRYESVTERNV